MAAFCVAVLGWPPDEAAAQFERLRPPLLPFRDATHGICRYGLTLRDCCAGLGRAVAVSGGGSVNVHHLAAGLV